MKQAREIEKETREIEKVAAFKIAKLDVLKGDILVLTTKATLSQQQAQSLRERIGTMLPEGVQVMVLAGGLEVGVLRTKTEAA